MWTYFQPFQRKVAKVLESWGNFPSGREADHGRFPATAGRALNRRFRPARPAGAPLGATGMAVAPKGAPTGVAARKRAGAARCPAPPRPFPGTAPKRAAARGGAGL